MIRNLIMITIGAIIGSALTYSGVNVYDRSQEIINFDKLAETAKDIVDVAIGKDNDSSNEQQRIN